MLKRLSLVIAGSLSLLMAALAPVSAATTSQSQTSIGNGNGLKISPVRTDLTIDPGHSQLVDVYIQNITNFTSNLQVIVNDFVARNESGTPALILNNNGPYNPHSLKQFVTPLPDFSLGPHEVKDLKVNITIPTSAAGGGYYGAIRVAPASMSAANNVSLTASVASLILLKVPGNLVDRLSLASFEIDQNGQSGSLFFSPGGISAVVRFENSGNIQEEPFGKVILKNSSGKIIDTVPVNNSDPPGNVLPNSIRRFAVPLSHVGTLGKYKVDGEFGYGSNGQLISAQSTFYVIPVWLIVLVIIVIVTVISVLFLLPRLMRAHDRRILRKADRLRNRR